MLTIKLLRTLLGAGALLGVAACEVDRQTGTTTAQGAAVGAATGAAIGLIRGDFLSTTLTGAAAGAAGGFVYDQVRR